MAVQEHSYRQILNSSMVIGGASLFTVLAGVVRTKLVAVFLGPGGVGLSSLYTSITTVGATLSAVGVGTSGVRQIAEAAGAGQDERVARTIAGVRWMLLRLGLIGAAVLAILSIPISQLTFGTTAFAPALVLLCPIVLFTAITDGRNAVFQGLRRIGTLAKVSVLSAVVNVAISAPIIVLWPDQAIVVLLLAASGTSLTISWWFARRVAPAQVRLTWREALIEVKPVIALGLAAMSSALMVSVIAYVVRVVVLRNLGLEAAGMYQSATALSGVYCGFILSAMGADFLPRLAEVANDETRRNRLVNEQAEVGLLLAFPGICATLALSPLCIELLYSAQFAPATDVLRWQVLGVLLRVASWPMAYLLLARGQAHAYFWTEAFYNVVHTVLIWVCIQLWGLPGTGIAFFGLYVSYGLLMCAVTRKTSRFMWSRRNARLAVIVAPTVAFVFLVPFVMPPTPWREVAMILATAFAGGYSIRMLLLLPPRQFTFQSLLDRIQRLRAAGLRPATSSNSDND